MYCLFVFWNFRKHRMYLGIVGVLCSINCYFEYGIRIRCIFCIYEHNMNIIFDIFRKNLENFPRSVNNYRTKYLFEILGGLLVPPHPIPGVNVKVPFREKIL